MSVFEGTEDMNRDVNEMGYEYPDMPGVRAGLEKFNAVAVSRDYDFMPSLQERLTRAARYLSNSARTIVDKVRALEVIVDTAGFDELLEQWIAVRAHTELATDVQTSAITLLNETCAQRVSRIVGVVQATKEQIEQRAEEGALLNLDHYSDPLLAYDATRLDELEQQAITLLVEEDQLRADKKMMDAALEILQSRPWQDHIKDWLPTGEQTRALVATALVGKAEADVVMAAIERVVQYVGILAGGYRLFALTETRNKIVDKLLDLRALKNKNKTGVLVLRERAQKILRHAELVEARACWVDNMRLVAKVMTEFSARLTVTAQLSEHSMQQASAELSGFKRFLRRISR